MALSSQPSELEHALEQLGPHDHLCSIYENEQDHFAVAIPFVRIGLARNEKCVYITDAESMDRVRRSLSDGGIDVAGSVASGALTLATKDQTYMRYGSFNPEWMFTYWREAVEQAQREGFTSLRATGETEWVMRGGPGLERWMEYESRLTHALAQSNAFALCQYNRQLYPPELILDVIRTHPIVIYRDTVCRNFYFVPPDEFLAEVKDGREVQRLLNNIRDREKLDNELRRARTELEQRVLERTRELRESEQKARHRNDVLEAVNRILGEALSCETEEELGRQCLAVAEAVTRSRFGFLCEVNKKGRLEAIAISDPGWAACRMEKQDGHAGVPAEFPIHGIYGRVVQDGNGFFTNDAHSHPDSIGTPEGHPGLHAFLGAPLTYRAKTIGMVGLANRDGGYREQDLEALEAMALAITQVLMQKRAERAVRTGEERLREAQKMESIGVLAGGIAHDFNNLLVGVVGNASLAEEMIPPGSPAGNLLRRIVKSGEQAAYLTRQLLAYAGKGHFVLEPVNLSEIVEEASDLIQGTLSKKIAVEYQLARELPVIEMDKSQMQQILMNLVVNGAEAIGRRAGRISISTGSRDLERSDTCRFAGWDVQPGPFVFLEVRDTGGGMDAATQARIFEPFFTTKFQGRGLGLAAVAGIVRALEGAIRVVSTPGAGTSFTVLVPAIRSAETSEPQVAEPQIELRGAGLVLFVDDEEIVREMARTSLERHGYRVLLADSGQAAIDLFKRNPARFALVVLDLSMPGMSGEETLPALRRIRDDIDVILSSGHSEGQALSGFAGTTVSGFLQKPYTSRELAEMVKRVRDKSRLAM